MYDNSEVEVPSGKQGGPSQYINYGIQELKINSITTKTASTGSVQVVYNVEGRPVTDLGFEGVEGAMGPVGRIGTNYFKTDNEEKVKEFQVNTGRIAKALGVYEAWEKIKASDFDDLIQQLNNVLTGKFARFKVSSEQYYNAKNKLGNKYKFDRYFFVESLDIKAEDSKLKFDAKNTYDVKPAVAPTNIGTPESATHVKAPADDLPF